MDIIQQKIKKYETIITNFLQERSQIKPATLTDCENIVIADTNGHHYQLLTIGWSKSRYIHSVSIHLDIAENGKIWLRANWTDTDIAEMLEEHGVPKSDIVLGFVPAYMRELSDYAVT